MKSAIERIFWWAVQDSNLRPSRCKRDALTNCANRPIPTKLTVVPRAGFEPAQPCGHKPLKLACLPISPPGPDYFSDTSFLETGLETDFLVGLSLISLSRASLADFSRI